MLNGLAAEVPPQGAGFETPTFASPTPAMSEDKICAVSSVALTYVVARAEPFHVTLELLTKSSPFTVSVKPEPPAVVEAGTMLVSAAAVVIVSRFRVAGFHDSPVGHSV